MTPLSTSSQGRNDVRPACGPDGMPGCASLRYPVLVVDDDSDTADACATLLRLHGYDARDLCDPTMALSVAVSMRARAALIDIQMPSINGLELARLFRRHAQLHDIALIAVSGWVRPFDRHRSRAAGFDLHLTKPVDADQLLDVIALFASGQARQRAPVGTPD